jgi:hypothetical protein
MERGSDVRRLPWVPRINGAFTKSFYVNHDLWCPSTAAPTPLLIYIARIASRIAEITDRLEKKLMSRLMSGSVNARFFGLDMGDWSVLLGGFALAALVLFLN